MNARRLAAPPAWSDADLERDRKVAIERFIAERRGTGNAPYLAAHAASRLLVEEFFVATGDLMSFRGGAALIDNPNRVRSARYLAAPIISADDLNTITSSTIGHRRRSIPASMAAKAGEVIEVFMDSVRFPWLFDGTGRPPTSEERERAILWTAGLLAAQDIATGRRGESAARQESAVAALLSGQRFDQVAPRAISLVGDLDPGTFCREASVVGQKCDVPVRLRDGRLLLIECKVSNSGTNSVKRLVREVGGKAPAWREQIGRGQCFTAAVLAGVYTMKSLTTARDEKGIVVFWEHDLDALGEFVQGAI